MKFAVLLFLLTPFIANADTLCVEDNTTKCRELGYTESSCPNGGVACQYDTSLWYCANWTCADGRLYSAENKPADKCGNCVATAYKNMTCYDCHEARCTSTTCAVGDVFYSDGTCCPVENFDCRKTPVGVVYALSATKGGVPYTTAQAETPGFKAEHGRVIALRKLTVNSTTYGFDPTKPFTNGTSSIYFGLQNTNVSGIANYGESTLLSAYQSNKSEIFSGKVNTAKFAATAPAYSNCTNGSYTAGTKNYNVYCAPSAVNATLEFYPLNVNRTNEIVGAGNWYLPATGELSLLYGLDVSKMTSGGGTTGGTGTTKTIVNNTLTALSDRGVDAKTLDSSAYWTSLEYSNGTIYMVYLSNGRRSETNRATTASVRASLEF